MKQNHVQNAFHDGCLQISVMWIHTSSKLDITEKNVTKNSIDEGQVVDLKTTWEISISQTWNVNQ